MYAKITQSGGRRYLQLVEGYRDDGGKVRHRTVANMGRLDQLGPEKLDPLIDGLNRALGRTQNTASVVVCESAKAFGDVFALHELWKELGFDRALQRATRSGRRKIDAWYAEAGFVPVDCRAHTRSFVNINTEQERLAAEQGLAHG